MCRRVEIFTITDANYRWQTDITGIRVSCAEPVLRRVASFYRRVRERALIDDFYT